MFAAPGGKMSVLRTWAFWESAFERCIKTFCQAILGVIGVAGVTPMDIDWKQALAVGGLGALASLLSSVISAPVNNAGPSLAAEVLTPPAPPVPADEV
jgi:hypothetical protein